MKHAILYTLLICFFLSCSKKKKFNNNENLKVSNLSGHELAKIHCTSCHAFVDPESLSKSIWKDDVLPSMGFRLGMYKGTNQPDSLFKDKGGEIVRAANIYPTNPILAKKDWKKIMNYYVENAPDSVMIHKSNKKIKMGLKHFSYRQPPYSNKFPLTSIVKILPNNQGIVYSDRKRFGNSLTFLNSDLKIAHKIGIRGAAIHYFEQLDSIYLTTIGKNLFPYDGYDGALQKVFRKEPGQNYNAVTTLIPEMQRPVFMEYGDLNNDGLIDIVACEFGNLLGKLVWYENIKDIKYKRHILKEKPGAIKSVIHDFDNDGLKDIIVLMAQGDEGVFYFKNNGDNTFFEKRLLSFSPLYGSQYLELADFNDDGVKDIMYVCGDNADKTPILKQYHGIYIFLNDGNLNFTKSYFYQLNGAYKALSGDYDLDGDLDIAAISHFPDYVNSPQESFVYLENEGGLKFSDYSFPEATNGRWLVIDSGDMDADGDIDLALGSFVYFKAKGDTSGLGKKWLNEAPSIIVLENEIK